MSEVRQLERGRIRFFVRPRVQIERPQSFADVQSFFFMLVPRGGGAARRVRVGRKRMPDRSARERLWAHVARVDAPAALLEEMGARSYETKTRGLRHQAAAMEVGRGDYEIVAHEDHAHLLYDLDENEAGQPALLAGLRLDVRGGCVAAVFNPEAKWRIRDRQEPDSPFSEPALFDDALMERFGDRRYAPLEPIFLDHEGAELVLIGGEQHVLASAG